MTMARPNVVSSGTRTPARKLRSSIQRCRAQPMAAITGSTAMQRKNGEMSVVSAIRKTQTARRESARSPWAKLMIRITPNMKDRPQASSA